MMYLIVSLVISSKSPEQKPINSISLLKCSRRTLDRNGQRRFEQRSASSPFLSVQRLFRARSRAGASRDDPEQNHFRAGSQTESLNRKSSGQARWDRLIGAGSLGQAHWGRLIRAGATGGQSQSIRLRAIMLIPNHKSGSS